jgi:hypothetical protein
MWTQPQPGSETHDVGNGGIIGCGQVTAGLRVEDKQGKDTVR